MFSISKLIVLWTVKCIFTTVTYIWFLNTVLISGTINASVFSINTLIEAACKLWSYIIMLYVYGLSPLHFYNVTVNVTSDLCCSICYMCMASCHCAPILEVGIWFLISEFNIGNLMLSIPYSNWYFWVCSYGTYPIYYQFTLVWFLTTMFIFGTTNV